MKIAHILLLLCLFQVIFAHNWFSQPASRANQAQTQTGCRYGGAGKRDIEGRQTCGGGPCCAGPCDASVRQGGVPLQTAARGDVVTLQWNTHNHPGGFIRFAWAPTSSTSVHADFDSRVDRYVCKEIGGCDASDVNYSKGTCSLQYTIPTWLSDGSWSLQWAYFGGSNNAGDYYACVDYTISGGSAVTTQSSMVFVGGDIATSDTSKCRFYTTDALHTCTQEPCSNGTYYNPSQGMSSFGPYSGPPRVYTGGSYYSVSGAPSTSPPPSIPPSTPPTSPPASPPATQPPSTPPTTPPASPPATQPPSTPPTTPPATPTVSGTTSGSASNIGSTPCTANTQCSSGVCQSSGFCYVTQEESKSKLSAGGIAAIVFAMIFVVLAVVAVIFFVVNKSELQYMAPFKGRV